MRKYFWLFTVNLLVLISISIVSTLLGFNQYLTSSGVNIPVLLGFSLLWGFGGAFISLFLSKTMAIKMMNVHLVKDNDSQFSEIKNLVSQLARQAGLSKTPDVGVYPSDEINAFATGSSENNSLVAVSTGLLSNMTKDELEGVLAHEIAHIKNGDMVIMTLIQGSVNAFVMFLSRIIAFAIQNMLRSNNDNSRSGGGMYYLIVMVLEILLSFFGFMAVCYFSRQREFRADAGGAKYSSNNKMKAALQRLKNNYSKKSFNQDKLAAMKINGDVMKKLFSTHPSLDERIEKLS